MLDPRKEQHEMHILINICIKMIVLKRQPHRSILLLYWKSAYQLFFPQ